MPAELVSTHGHFTAMQVRGGRVQGLAHHWTGSTRHTVSCSDARWRVAGSATWCGTRWTGSPMRPSGSRPETPST
jgi:hypothetical protein